MKGVVVDAPEYALVNKNLRDLQPDPKNANKGTTRGQAMIESSLRTYGAGRSILIDKHGSIIAGNKTVENCGTIGMNDVLVVQTDGTKLVAVQRMDLDLNDKAAQELAIADNRAGQISLDWDVPVIEELDIDVSKFWNDAEFAAMQAKGELNDAAAEWIGMPEFTSQDLLGVRQIIIHFKTKGDVAEFAALLGQSITDKTRYLWYPKLEAEDLKSFAYTAEAK